MRAMSMSAVGSLSRSFISGTRLWPPASSLPPPSAPQLRDRVVERRGAVVVECGRDHAWPPWMMRHSFSGRSIMSMCFTPNSLSASTAAETMHGVEPSVPASPTPLAPSGLTGVGVTVLSQLEAREVGRARHRVVHERAGDELAVLVVDDLFDHRLADALRQAAVNLALDDQRVDQVAGIVHGDQLQQLRLAGLAIDLEHRDVAAERVGVVGSARRTLRR